ncbi:hypothetical protein ACU4GH_38585 [Bradyrhizobium betae]
MWWWLATPITLARALIDPAEKVQCVSYAPFRGEQTPLGQRGPISTPSRSSSDWRQLEGDHRLRPHLFDGEWARPGAGDRSQGRRV